MLKFILRHCEAIPTLFILLLIFVLYDAPCAGKMYPANITRSDGQYRTKMSS